MKHVKGWKALVTSILFLIFCSLLSVSTALAAEAPENVTIRIHKLLFESGEKPSEETIKNDGTEKPLEDSLLDNYTGKNGVAFSVYDVSEEYYSLRKQGLSVEAAQKQIATEKPRTEKIATETTQMIDGEDGVADFSLLRKDEQNRDAAYLFLEEATSDVLDVSPPLVIILPILDEAGSPLDIIHLYPKNEQLPETVPNLVKEVESEHLDFQYGDVIPYKVTVTIPNNIGSYQKFDVTDEADSSLWLDRASLSVQSTSELPLKEEGYQIRDITDHSFKISFNPEQLVPFAGGEIVITYRMTLKDTHPEQSKFENIATLTSDREPPIESQKEIFTGGKRFIKVDISNHNQPLAKAKFVIANKAGYYLSRINGVNIWKKNLSKDSYTLVSDQAGRFSINGLAYGNYQLIETSPPSGYVLNKTPITFTVNAMSYLGTDQEMLQVVNKKIGEESSVNPLPPGKLPQMGEGAKNLLMSVGLCLVFSWLLLVIQKNKIKEQEK